MKANLFIVLFLVAVQTGYCQMEKLLKGKVVSDNFALEGIEVINKTNQKITVTDNQGLFSIEAKEGDQLFFFGKEYTSTSTTVSQNALENHNFRISLSKKPIEIDEIVIEKGRSVWTKSELQRILDVQYFDDGQSSPKNKLIYNGQTHGIDFAQIGRRILKSLKKNRKQASSIPFKDYITAKFNQNFFLETLELKPDEIHLYLEFCEADPKSQSIIDSDDNFTVMDFLIAKKMEFKKSNK